MARDAGVKRLVLTHITEQLDRPGIRERAISEMAEVFRGDILFGNDLLEVPMAGAAPGKLD
jgi:ribonuclease Z